MNEDHIPGGGSKTVIYSTISQYIIVLHSIQMQSLRLGSCLFLIKIIILNVADDRNPVFLNMYPESVLWNVGGVGLVSFGYLNAYTVR
jgi:hypothetical protein